MTKVSESTKGNNANTVLANVFTSVVSLKFFVAIQRDIGEFNLKMETYRSLGENNVEVKIRFDDPEELVKLNQRAKAPAVSKRLYRCDYCEKDISEGQGIHICRECSL